MQPEPGLLLAIEYSQAGKRLGSASSKPVTCRLAVVRRVGMIPIDANHEAANVIDDQDQAVRLLRKLTEVLPLSALAAPALLAHLRGRSSAAKITLDCVVTKVFYLGDEGGITCHVTFDEEEKEEVFLVSITQLAFDRRLPVAREIAAYQKHRIKRIRRNNVTPTPAPHH
jgi:hypothetical protein